MSERRRIELAPGQWVDFEVDVERLLARNRPRTLGGRLKQLASMARDWECRGACGERVNLRTVKGWLALPIELLANVPDFAEEERSGGD